MNYQDTTRLREVALRSTLQRQCNVDSTADQIVAEADKYFKYLMGQTGE